MLAIVADVSDETAVKNYVDQTVKEFGTIDGFYNNAGIEGKQTPLIEYDTNTFKKVIEINLLGVFYGMKYIIPVMIKNGGGKIVNVSSVDGILTNAIAPGAIMTPMVEEAFRQVNPDDPNAAETVRLSQLMAERLIFTETRKNKIPQIESPSGLFVKYKRLEGF